MLNMQNKSFTLEPGVVLSAHQKEQYIRDGFLVIENFIAPAICQLLMQRANELITQFEPSMNKTSFSAVNHAHATKKYFLDSGDKIHFFFEENALNAQGELITDKLYAINKIGHGLHDVDPIFNCFSRMHKIAMLIDDLNIAGPRLIQSMYICKQPHIGGEVTCHQDATFLHTDHAPVTGLWFALEDATLENGCLWAIPGGHRTPLKSQSIRTADDNMETKIFAETPWELEKMVPLEVTQGSLIILHGLAPHMSKENKSARSRHAYTLHVTAEKDGYPDTNWLRRSPNNPFRGFIE